MEPPRYVFENGKFRQLTFGAPSASNPDYTDAPKSELTQAMWDAIAEDLQRNGAIPDHVQPNTFLTERYGMAFLVNKADNCALLQCDIEGMKAIYEDRYHPIPYTGIIHTMFGTLDESIIGSLIIDDDCAKVIKNA